MSKFFKNKAFLIGFVSGIIFLISLNFLTWLQSLCHHCIYQAGIPYTFYEEFIGNIYFDSTTFSNDNFKHFFPLYLLLDVVSTIIFGFVVGLIVKSVWSENSHSQLD